MITYTGPSSSETRAHFSGGTGVAITDGSVAIGQSVATDSNVSFNDLTLSGNLTINGTTTNIDTTNLVVEDPLIKLSKNNSNDSVDIGIYGLYGTSSTYSGLFRDSSDSGKWKLFKGLTSEPTTTIDTTHSSYSLGTLVADIEGDVTGQVSDISNHNTGDLTEGSNLYYTDTRA